MWCEDSLFFYLYDYYFHIYFRSVYCNVNLINRIDYKTLKRSTSRVSIGPYEWGLACAGPIETHIGSFDQSLAMAELIKFFQYAKA